MVRQYAAISSSTHNRAPSRGPTLGSASELGGLPRRACVGPSIYQHSWQTSHTSEHARQVDFHCAARGDLRIRSGVSRQLLDLFRRTGLRWVLLLAVDAWASVSPLRPRISRFGIHSPSMVIPLSRFFRYGTPALVILCALGEVPWWLVVMPVIPMWWSAVMSTHEAHQRARFIRRPSRSTSLQEAAAERRFANADAVLIRANTDRAEALAELAQARAAGQREVRRPNLPTTRTGRRG